MYSPKPVNAQLLLDLTSGSAMAEGPRDALVSRNSATYKTSHLTHDDGIYRAYCIASCGKIGGCLSLAAYLCLFSCSALHWVAENSGTEDAGLLNLQLDLD